MAPAYIAVSLRRGIVTRQALKPGNNIIKSVADAASHADKGRTATMEPVLFRRGLALACQFAILFLVE
jgi:hypothetical protein